jgi:flavin reductase (DIM6/NTAB) family NADH-FMN oxidoreductase RutF
MFLDVLAEHAPRWTILNALVAPRPIAWVSSVNAQGVSNLAPFSYFNLLSNSPPTLIFSCVTPADRVERDTLANVRATGEFVVNLVSRELLETMHATSAAFPHGDSEFAAAGLEPAPSVHVRPPRVGASPASIECRVLHFLPIPPERPGEAGCTAVVGRVVGIHVAPELMDARGHFDSARARLMARLGGPQYAELGAIIELTSVAGNG